jgi:hypothetical protein
MNYEKAIQELELTKYVECNNISLNFIIIKKQYHKLALKFHPDKNKSFTKYETTNKFQNIQEAYEYLIPFYYEDKIENVKKNNEEPQKQTTTLNKCRKYNNNEDFLYFVGERTTSVYIDLLKNFIILMFDKINIKYSQEIENIIINNCKNISLQFLDKFDKSNILLLYQFLHTYQSIFSLDNELLNNIFEIIKKKYETEIYILNPTLNDLLNDNIYKLSIDNIIYYVPLWFNELTFENNNNNEINVICIPEIENNISIDEENNLTYYFSYLFNIDIFDKEYLEIIINLDNNSKKSFNIPTQELYIKKKQIYTFKNEGILKKKNCIFNLNETNQINKSYRSDIIICITFLFE